MPKTETGVPEKQDKNPLGSVDKQAQRFEPSVETDRFSPEEQKEIVKMVVQDSLSDIDAMAEWVQKRKKDLQMYNGEKPSVIENLNKKRWQSDRNMRLTTSVCDAFQATLLATCFNPDTIHVKATEPNDVNRKDDIETFTKWGLGPSESNIFKDVNDFIQNRIVQGFCVAKVYWKVWYEWIDRRIPKYGKPVLGVMGKRQFLGYDIKTEKVRFEKCVVDNVADMDDILIPSFGKNVQELNHLIHIVHLNGQDVVDYADRNIFVNVDDKYVDSLKGACFDERIKVLGKEKANSLGLIVPSDISTSDLRQFPIDVYEWYGTYTKNGRTEKYRFTVEPVRMKFLAGKPLRKIPGCRNGKIPFVGGALRRIPGQVRGESLPTLVADICNAFNNIYNQKSDFQYVENCPFGFHKPDENFDKQVFELEPGVSYPSEDPKNINFPNLSRSMAWVESDVNILLQMIERLTGAASYFQSRETQSKTLGQDMLIEKNMDTRFGLWVKDIIADLSELITMWLNMYQDCAPTTLGERVLGEDGKKLFPNLSIETLRGGYDVYLSPDIVAGSKMFEKQLAMFALEAVNTNVWFNPQINPRGNWQLTADSFKKIGFMDIESYMPPKPPGELGTSAEVDKVWQQFMQGEVPEVNENMDLMEMAAGMAKKAKDEFYKLDEEYRPNVENYMFKLSIAMRQQMKKAQEQAIAQQMASKIIMDNENKIIEGQVPQVQPTQQGVPSGVPGEQNVNPIGIG
jgi:hypothetical protein